MVDIRDLTKDEAIHEIYGPDFPIRSLEEIHNLQGHLARTDRYIGVFWEGFPLGVFGVARPSLLDDRGYIWLLETPLAREHAIGFLRAARKVAVIICYEYREPVGLCVNPANRRWLTWVGADFGPPTPAGWLPFTLRSPNG